MILRVRGKTFKNKLQYAHAFSSRICLFIYFCIRDLRYNNEDKYIRTLHMH